MRTKEEGYFPITLYWHLDGAPALKSKNISVWPIQSFVVELPVNLRYSSRISSYLAFGMVKKKKPQHVSVGSPTESTLANIIED